MFFDLLEAYFFMVVFRRVSMNLFVDVPVFNSQNVIALKMGFIY